jgi:hypothetical protein
MMFTHIWFWRSRLSERKGQLCKVIARGKLNSILVEFADGFKVVTSRYAVRSARDHENPGRKRASQTGGS